jgi:ribosomal protein S27AE
LIVINTLSDIEVPLSVVDPPLSGGRPQLYHIACSRCGAVSMRDVANDAVRIICGSCNRRLTLPTSITGRCSNCGSETQFPHTLAGHSSACGACRRPVTLGPVVGEAHSGHRSHEHNHHSAPITPHKREHRHVALRDGAERSLILVVAGLATLIFIVAVTIL